MNLQNITLIYFDYFDTDFLQKVTENIYNVFFINVQIKEGHLDLSDYYEPLRRQYNAGKLLQSIQNRYASDTTKTIGLFNVDFFIPIFTYIFGQAFLGGQAGVASLFRLNNESYGVEPDVNLLMERFSKEIIHEIGHTFGLLHCHVPYCVMRSSTYAEDIDQKDSDFCPKCREMLPL